MWDPVFYGRNSASKTHKPPTPTSPLSFSPFKNPTSYHRYLLYYTFRSCFCSRLCTCCRSCTGYLFGCRLSVLPPGPASSTGSQEFRGVSEESNTRTIPIQASYSHFLHLLLRPLPAITAPPIQVPSPKAATTDTASSSSPPPSSRSEGPFGVVSTTSDAASPGSRSPALSTRTNYTGLDGSVLLVWGLGGRL